MPKFSPIISHFYPFCRSLAFARRPCSTTFDNLVNFWRLVTFSSRFFLHRITLMWLNGRSFYVFGTLEFSPEQFIFVLMNHIFINRDCKELCKIIVHRMCIYVQSAKTIVETRFQCRNAGLAGYILCFFFSMLWPILCTFFYLFLIFFLVSQGYKSLIDWLINFNQENKKSKKQNKKRLALARPSKGDCLVT